MSNLIHFELVSPEEKLISEDVYLAEIPGDNGIFGVAAGHCSLVSSLGLGTVKLHKEQGEETRDYFIAGGFSDVTPTSCTVLAEQAIELDKLNLDELKKSLQDLNEDLEMAEEKADKKRVKDQIEIVKAKIYALTGY